MRSLTAAVTAALSDSVLRPVWLARVGFGSGTLYVWSGTHPLEWNGETWVAVGHLGAVSTISETEDLRAAGLTISLSGLPSSTLALVLGDAELAQTATLYLALVDDDENIVADPIEVFTGSTDVPRIQDDGESATVSMFVESELIALDRPKERHYTHEDQQLDYPGDLGFEYVIGVASGTTEFAGEQTGVQSPTRHPRIP